MSKVEEIKSLFFKLLSVNGISGFEEPMIKTLMEELSPLCDEVYQTPRGNVIGVQHGTDPDAPKVALAAHTDQVGFIVFSVDDRGFLRFRKIGGSVTGSIQGHQMKVHGKKGPVMGVAGIKPGHMTKPSEANTIPPIEQLYIDVGALSREEVYEMGIEVGTPITWNTGPVELANNFVATAAADDRAGLTAIITVAKNLKDKPIPATVYYIGTVEEEIGLRGAEVALFDLDVDMAVAIDTCPSGYQPDVKPVDIVYEVGKGPALQVAEAGSRGIKISSRIPREWIAETAEKHNLPYQRGIMYGGTDASAMQQTKTGVPAVPFSIPRRYSHSPVELLSLDDLYNLTEILTSGLSELDKGFKFLRV
ncbi:MAG: M20/M25/M40 family metallo-hydrolase [Candidatus Bathyarchaeota archaeon]|nr:M20/M25/M40 family metallo-hydrolase [Candidatus Bathyarchaeota archaeon]